MRKLLGVPVVCMLLAGLSLIAPTTALAAREITAAPARGCAYQITPHETLVVIHKEVGPGGMQFPYVQAKIRVYVCPGYVPRGGLLRITLQHRRTVLSHWMNAGQVSFTEPWKAGWTVTKTILTPCINLHSWWRLREQFDFILYNGMPYSYTRYWPKPARLGARFTCQIIGGPER